MTCFSCGQQCHNDTVCAGLHCSRYSGQPASVYNNWRPYRAYPGANFTARVPVDSPTNNILQFLTYLAVISNLTQATANIQLHVRTRKYMRTTWSLYSLCSAISRSLTAKLPPCINQQHLQIANKRQLGGSFPCRMQWFHLSIRLL